MGLAKGVTTTMALRALRIFPIAVTIALSILGCEAYVSPLAPGDLIKMGKGFFDAGDYVRAEGLFRDAVKMAEKGDQTALPIALRALAGAYEARGKYDEAARCFERLTSLLEKTKGEGNADLGTVIGDWAWLEGKRREFDKARTLYRRSQAILEKSLGPNHPRVAVSIHNRAILSYVEGDYAGAEALYRQAVSMLDATPEARYPELAQALASLGEVLLSQKRYAEAEPVLRRAISIAEESGGPDDRFLLGALHDYAAVLEAMGREVEAKNVRLRVDSLRSKMASRKTGRPG